MRAMSVWQSEPPTHLWVVNASSQVHTRMVMDSPVAAVLIVLLLSKTWDLYVCPQTLATLSAGSQSSALICTLVFLWWCKLSFHSLVVEHLTMEDKKHKKKWPGKTLRKRMLLWSLWCVLTLVLSVLAISYGQVHPRLSSSWKDVVVRLESLHWGQPRSGEQLSHPFLPAE